MLKENRKAEKKAAKELKAANKNNETIINTNRIENDEN